MKKLLTFLMVVVMSMIMVPVFSNSVQAAPAFAAVAQTRRHRRHKRSFYQKHKDKIHIAAGAGIGALAGGLIGGKRGAGIGLLAGGGGTALYKYKKHKHRRHHYRRP